MHLVNKSLCCRREGVEVVEIRRRLALPLYISMFRVAFPGLSPLGTPVTHRSVEYLNVLWGSVLLQLHPFTSRHDIGL
jgi:hypothetical protein